MPTAFGRPQHLSFWLDAFSRGVGLSVIGDAGRQGVFVIDYGQLFGRLGLPYVPDCWCWLQLVLPSGCLFVAYPLAGQHLDAFPHRSSAISHAAPLSFLAGSEGQKTEDTVEGRLLIFEDESGQQLS